MGKQKIQLIWWALTWQITYINEWCFIHYGSCNKNLCFPNSQLLLYFIPVSKSFSPHSLTLRINPVLKAFKRIPLLSSPPQTCRENNILGDKLVVHDGELWQLDLCHSCDCIITPTPVKLNVICCIAIYKNRNKQVRYKSLLTSWGTVHLLKTYKIYF